MHGSTGPPLVASRPRWVRRWAAIKIGPDLRRSLESDDVAQGLLQLRALVVEGLARHADADRAEEPAVLVEHRRGQTAEVLLELLALRRDAGQPDGLELVVQALGVGDGGGGEAPEADRGGVAL